jgi:hypothetical protein
MVIAELKPSILQLTAIHLGIRDTTRQAIDKYFIALGNKVTKYNLHD